MGGEVKRGPREEGVDVLLPKSKEKYAKNNESPKEEMTQKEINLVRSNKTGGPVLNRPFCEMDPPLFVLPYRSAARRCVGY
jgi:hypothetical protein